MTEQNLPSSKDETSNEEWAKDELIKLAGSAQKEQRLSNRVKWAFWAFIVLYMFSVLFLFKGRSDSDNAGSVSEAHIARVDVEGAIAAKKPANAEAINEALEKAFKAEQAKAVVLYINSPGGSPVQSAYIYDTVRRLKDEHEKPVYAVIADVGASGAYYIAASADKIYVNKGSLVGSIGVRMNNFSVQDLMNKVGVKSRTITAGDNKAIADPFSAMTEKQRAHLQGIADNIHQQFIDAVKEGRGSKLEQYSADSELFSGLVWTGEQAIEKGLADEEGNVSSIARDVVKVEHVINYSSVGSGISALIREIRGGVSMMMTRLESTGSDWTID